MVEPLNPGMHQNKYVGMLKCCFTVQPVPNVKWASQLNLPISLLAFT